MATAKKSLKKTLKSVSLIKKYKFSHLDANTQVSGSEAEIFFDLEETSYGSDRYSEKMSIYIGQFSDLVEFDAHEKYKSLINWRDDRIKCLKLRIYADGDLWYTAHVEKKKEGLSFTVENRLEIPVDKFNLLMDRINNNFNK